MNGSVMALVIPPCNLKSGLAIDDANIAKLAASHRLTVNDKVNLESEIDFGGEAVVSVAHGPDGGPLMAVGCGSTIPILATIEGSVGLSVVYLEEEFVFVVPFSLQNLPSGLNFIPFSVHEP
jgi:hypothetical protein